MYVLQSNSGAEVSVKNLPDGLKQGQVVEVRGIVNDKNTLTGGQHTLYDESFDLQTFELMLEHYHGMGREATVFE